MVDDGSTDSSAEIAERVRRARPALQADPPAQRRPQRRAQHRHRRRHGRVPRVRGQRRHAAPNAYELLLGALDETGSDFATGNVLRLTALGHVAGAVPRAGVRRDPARDARHRVPPAARRPHRAWNKLFRRSFWDAQGFRFPEGVLNEDIPVILPAHFAARSVDVIADPIYF